LIGLNNKYHKSLINLFYDGQSWFIHTFDLLDTALEKISIIPITDVIQISFILSIFVEFILSTFDLPIFSILQQNYYLVLVVKSDTFYVWINFNMDKLLSVVHEIFKIQWVITLDSYYPSTITIDCFSEKVYLFSLWLHTV